MHSSGSWAPLLKATANVPNTELMASSLKIGNYGDLEDFHLLALSLIESVFLNSKPHNSRRKNTRNFTCTGTTYAPNSSTASAART